MTKVKTNAKGKVLLVITESGTGEIWLKGELTKDCTTSSEILNKVKKYMKAKGLM